MKDQVDRKILLAVVIYLLGLLLAGTIGYYLIEDPFTLFDAFYMTIITITTVGFREIHALSPAGRAFTVIILVLGFGVVALAATQLARFVIGRELSGVFGRKKMMKRIHQLTGHYLLCGFDNITQAICLKLMEYSIPFVVIDSDEAAIAHAQEFDYATLEGDPTKDTTLILAGIKRAGGIVAGLSSDADNLFITLAARELQPSIHIITRGNERGIEERLRRAGADTVVYPLKLGGQQIARLISQQCGVAEANAWDAETGEDPGVLGYYLRTYRHYGDEQVTVEQACDKMNAMQAVALKKADGMVSPYPLPEEVLQASDILVMLVNDGFAADARSIAVAEGEADTVSPTWNDELSVGILSIDEEHRHIFGMISRLEQAIAVGRGKQVMAEVFDELLEYTATHFRHEEKLFDVYEYPDREKHRKQHEIMVQQVKELNRDRRYVFPENLADYLRDWLSNHIMKTDKLYAEFLREKGAK